MKEQTSGRRKGQIHLYDKEIREQADEIAAAWVKAGIAQPGHALSTVFRMLLRCGIEALWAMGGPARGLPMPVEVGELISKGLGEKK